MGRMGRWVTAATAGFGAVLAVRALTGRKTHRHFAGASVVIVGGSRGLGLALARAFAAEGARLALLATDRWELQRAESELSEAGTEVMAIACDIRDQEAVQSAIDSVARRYGRIDVLVNDAGIIQVGPVEHATLDDFENAMAVHMWGPLYTILAALPYMPRHADARIVNISSIGGKIAVPHLLPYSASKFALTGLSDGLRSELAKDGIRVTTVCPGLMRTGSHGNAVFKGRHRAEFTWFALLDALPFTSTDARSAAAQIIEACRAGQAELIITPQARAAIKFQALFPNLTAGLIDLWARVLPRPVPQQVDGRIRYSGEAWLGWDSGSELAPSPLTKLADRAAVANNELPAQKASRVIKMESS